MWLADLSIKRPVFISMIILVLVLFGIISYPTIGVDLYPKVDFPIVSVSTTLRGASPEIIDIDVTDKIEGAINTINGVKSITSTSIEGVSNVIVEFELDRDIDFAVQDVREKMSFVKGSLPKDVDDPVIMKVDTDSTPIMWLALSGTQSQRELSTYTDEILKEKLQKIQGVGSIHMGGLRLRQIRIWLDREKLNTYGITAHDIVQAIQRKNIELPGGRIETDTKEYSIKIKGELKDVEEFNNLIIKYQNGSAIKLKDLATVQDGMEEERSVSKFNGQRAVAMGIQKQSGTNTVKVIEKVKEEIKSVKKTLPKGMDIQVAFDQSTFIKRSIEEVQKHLIFGAIFTVLIVFLFLKSLRLTWISAISIPVSIISTFAMMKLLGFTFNNMSMLALSLSIGVVIDDAIVVIENIHRHVAEGMHPREAASFATREIGLAVVATTVAIIVIFLPVAFMKGIIGRFFMQFALTVVFAVMISLLISFTITPMLASRFMKHKTQHNQENKFYEWLEKQYKSFEEIYRKALIFALDNRKKVIISAILIFIASLFMTKFIGKEFVPSEDQGSFVVNLESPIDYSVKMTNNMFSQAEKIVKDIPEVNSIFYAQGSGHAQEVNKGVLFVNLKPKHDRKRNQTEIQSDVRKQLRSIIGLESSVEDVSLIGGGARRVPIQFIIKGENLNELEKHLQQIYQEFSILPGIVDVDTSIQTGKPEVRVIIDRDRAADLDVDIATIVETINFLMSGEIDITKYKDTSKGRRYDVRMRLLKEDRVSAQDIGQIYVRSNKEEFVQLSNIIHIQEAGGPSTITRLDRQRAVTLYANLEGKPLGQAKAELDEISSRILPENMSFQYRGMADTMGESFLYMMYALILGIILAYMVLAAQFENFIHPFTILLSMPLAFIGAFGALLLTGKTLNIFSFIGLILLMGLVKKNAILLVDFTNTLRKTGMPRKEAIISAGPIRLKPILMTTFAMIFGMLPIALGLGEGSETRMPMAIVVIGGLITSLFLTLVVVPVVYDIFDEALERFFKKKKANPVTDIPEIIERVI